MRGKTITMYLADGTPEGIIKASLANRTSVMYRIPRAEINKAKHRDDLKQSGVYFLFGYSERLGKPIVYVGKGGHRQNDTGTLGRLIDHVKGYDEEKDIHRELYWTEAIVLSTLNNSFGPTEISYLENAFYNLAVNNGNYHVRNAVVPNMGNVTEEKESELLEIIEDAKILIGALGQNVFSSESSLKEEVKPEAEERNKSKDTLTFVSRTLEATGNVTSDGFIVHKGSQVSETLTPSASKAVVSVREKYQASIEDGVLISNVLINSPSAAAAFVAGADRAGYDYWKNAEGKTLREIEAEAVED